MKDFVIGDKAKWGPNGEIVTIVELDPRNSDLVCLKWPLGSIGWHRKKWCVPINDPNKLIKEIL